jgi:hypothetical protein
MDRETRSRMFVSAAVVLLSRVIARIFLFPLGPGALLPAALFTVVIFVTMTLGVLLIEGDWWLASF